MSKNTQNKKNTDTDKIGEVIIESIDKLLSGMKSGTDSSAEMALIALNGGCELAIRDRLLYVLQEKIFASDIVDKERVIVRSEYSVSRTKYYESKEYKNIKDDETKLAEFKKKYGVAKRSDMAIIRVGSDNEILALIEFKNNYSCDLKSTTGFSFKELESKVEKKPPSVSDFLLEIEKEQFNFSATRVFEDYNKWIIESELHKGSNLKNKLYGVNFVINFTPVGPVENKGIPIIDHIIKKALKHNKMNSLNNPTYFDVYKIFLKKIMKINNCYKAVHCKDYDFSYKNISGPYYIESTINVAIHKCNE